MYLVFLVYLISIGPFAPESSSIIVQFIAIE